MSVGFHPGGWGDDRSALSFAYIFEEVQMSSALVD